MPTSILLISEQTLPNVLFLKQFGPFERHVFLTTEKMETQGRSNWIIQAAGIDPDSVQRLPIDPEDATVGLYKLEQQDWPSTEYLVNITGGTKMMALAAYAFFAGKPRIRIVYQPLNAPHFLELHPDPKETPHTVGVSLLEYLQAYGVVIQSQTFHWQKRIPEAKEVMDAAMHKGESPRTKDIRDWMRNENSGALSNSDRKFYMGEWFEIWMANQIQTLLGIPEDNISVGAKLNLSTSQKIYTYEYDIIFIFQNRLYTCECKYFHYKGLTYGKLREELFKYASVAVQFGLNAKAFFAIGNKTDVVDEELEERCKLLRLPYPASQDILTDPQAFKSFIEKL